ncbi:hypothetical protein MHYP_G00195980 [Metynnis hypsauchen]
MSTISAMGQGVVKGEEISCVVQQLCKRGPRLHSLGSSSLSHDVMRVRSALSVCVQCKPESGSPSCLSECRCGGLVVAAGVTAGS